MMMNNIFILINKELLNIKKFIFQYIFILFLFPCLLYLFLTIPLSRVFINLKPIYSIWVCSGILFVSVLFNIYILNSNWILKLYDNNFIKTISLNPKIINSSFSDNIFKFYSTEKVEYFKILKYALDSEIEDIDISNCSLEDIFKGIYTNDDE